MSDMFDHELDAWESLNNEFPFNDGEYDGYRTPKYDPNFYHTWIEFNKLITENSKSYLIEYKKGFEVWIPKKIVRGFEDKRIFVHGSIFFSIIKNKIAKLQEKAV